MNSTLKLGIAAAAVVVAGVVGLNLLPGTGEPAVGVQPVSPSPSPSPSPASQVVPADAPLAAGRYHIDTTLYEDRVTSAVPGLPTRAGVARVTFTVPDGWTGGGWYVSRDGEPETALNPFVIDRVILDPCSSLGAVERGETAGRPMTSIDGLAEALTSSWTAGSAFAPTSPAATTATRRPFAGLDSRYVEITTPTDLDHATCDEGHYVLWEDPNGGQRWTEGPGALNRLFIVDVDGASPDAGGGLLVIDVAAQPGTSAEGLAELQAIVDSIEIELLSGS